MRIRFISLDGFRGRFPNDFLKGFFALAPIVARGDLRAREKQFRGETGGYLSRQAEQRSRVKDCVLTAR